MNLSKLLLLVFLGINNFSVSQNSRMSGDQSRIIDSLSALLKRSTQDSVKARLFLETGKLYEKTNSDTAIFFYNKIKGLTQFKNTDSQNQLLYAKSFLSLGLVYCTYKEQYDSAEVITKKALNIFNELIRSGNNFIVNKAKIGKADCYYCFGNINEQQGIYDLANEFYFKSLKIYESLVNKKEILALNSKIGNIFWYLGSFDKAMKYFLKSYKIAEEIGDKKGKAMCYINIGNVQYEQSNFESAIDYYLKASKIFEEIHDRKGMSISYNNVGAINSERGFYNKAVEYYRKSLKIKEELGDKKGAASCYVNLGSAYKWLRDYKLTNEYYTKALQINEDVKDRNSIAVVLNFIAVLHLILADSVVTTQNEKNIHYNEAINFALKSYKIGKEMNTLVRIQNSALNLQKAYKAVGKYEKALEYAEIYEMTNDSVFKEEKIKAIAEMTSKYKSEKKQRKIELLEQNKVLQDEEITRQRLLRNSFIIGFILLLFTAIVILGYYQQKRKANKLLTIKHSEIEQQKVAIQEAHQIITDKNNIIIESIEHAKTIQDAILTSNESLTKIFPEHFVLFLPKDIVSGDFYWAYQSKANKVFWAAADCTGHGVSGAFMTIIGNSLLNEIIIENGIEEPNLILGKLRDSIVKTLNKNVDLHIHEKMRQGMDIALCVWNKENNQLQFSGANSSAWIIKSDKAEGRRQMANGKNGILDNLCLMPYTLCLEELKGDKQPIGFFKKATPFHTHTYELQKDDKLYIFSDGFSDQIGGPDEQRFKINQVKQALLEVRNLDMHQQKEKLLKVFQDWKGNIEQIDDVVMIGVKI